MALKKWISALLAMLGMAVIVYLAGDLAERRTLSHLNAQALTAAELNSALVRNGFERYRPLPFVLSQNIEVLRVLDNPSQANILSLDASLESLAKGVEASAIYVLDTKGLAIAASNWRDPATFVGVDYQFRPYFQDAMRSGESEHFALGTVSHLPGLYFSRRVVDADGRAVGVVVVKVDFVRLESDWQHQRDPVFVTDENGVVLLTNETQWRFRTFAPIDADKAQQLRTSLQFGDSDLKPLDLKVADRDLHLVDAPNPAGNEAGQSVGVGAAQRAPLPASPDMTHQRTYLHTHLPIDTLPGWMLHTLTSVQPFVSTARINAQLLAALASVILIGATVIILRRRERVKQDTRRRIDMVNQLEREVAARTHQLETTHHSLASALEEKLNTQARVQILQEELAQANKLTVLGQVAAGVAHEINQPLAAIRSYANNTATFLQRQQTQAALKNLSTIAGLTDRISTITNELKHFSRRDRSRAQRATRVQDAIDGALLLMGATSEHSAVAVSQRPPHTNLLASIDKIRLEQILVNLLQNARDAVQGSTDPAIRITVEALATGDASPGNVRITVSDNGMGLSETVLAALFTPFTSSKREGLGLGLVICRDLAQEAGGELSAHNHTDSPGAKFVLELPAAHAGPGPQEPHEP